MHRHQTVIWDTIVLIWDTVVLIWDTVVLIWDTVILIWDTIALSETISVSVVITYPYLKRQILENIFVCILLFRYHRMSPKDVIRQSDILGNKMTSYITNPPFKDSG